MKTVSVHDTAAYIIRKLGPISHMKLQKLVYYCQAWSLVWDEVPLFGDEIEAWANGPVVKRLYQRYKGQFLIEDATAGNPSKLNPTQRETVDAVLKYYGQKSAQWLSDLSHREDPWRDTRKGLEPRARSNRTISLAAMHEYYSSL